MKTKILNFKFRMTNFRQGPGNAAGHSQFAIRNSPFRQGMALVITLIMLAVTLVMAVAFLAVARRERNAVTTTTDTTTARLAADIALAAAQAQIAADILVTNAAAFDYHVFVSTNYQATNFVTGIANATNVYYYYANGNFLAGDDLIQNIANLYLLPRVPVLTTVETNFPAGRFFLDLNRNGKYDPSGYVLDTNYLNLPTGGVAYEAAGDPEWIGVLERPDQPHGPNNHFIARYAFLAQPIGNSLDLNFIHNQVENLNLSVANDGFFRNQGVGSWELNLASFLADLNTNVWDPPTIENVVNNPYTYRQTGLPPLLSSLPNLGVAFEDALSILSWRYNFNYNNLSTAEQIFGNKPFNDAATIFPADGIDGYSDGPLQITVRTNADLPTAQAGGDKTPDVTPWAGSDNPNRFFSLLSDVFGASQNLGNFPAHLATAGGGNATYDRYTFYRMLDELGTDSTVDSGKLHLNYSNAVVQYDSVSGVVTNIGIIPGAETNLVPWVATNFFHAAANQMLLAYTKEWHDADYHAFTNTFEVTEPFGVTNVPVYVNGHFVYSPAVNRVLQLAANIYDAGGTNFFPTVFRPMFSRINTNVFITSYTLVSQVVANDPQLAAPFDLEYFAAVGGQNVAVNIYGVPWIIGAKRGLPNFNMLAMFNAAQVTRKLQVVRNNTNADHTTLYRTNQLYVLSLSNNVSVSFWNSYTAAYPRPVTVYAFDQLDMILTNAAGLFYSNRAIFTIPSVTISSWPGSAWGTPPNNSPATASFYATNWVMPFASSAVYWPRTGQLLPSSTGWDYADPLLPLGNSGPLGLMTTNRFQAVILDGTHVLDYVQLRGPSNSRNLTEELADPNYPDGTGAYLPWATNKPSASAPNYGVLNQLAISADNSLDPYPSAGTKYWVTPPNMPNGTGPNPTEEAEYFAGFFTTRYFDHLKGQTFYNTELTNQAPYTPTRTVYDYTLWQANDPLVHYLGSDLNYVGGGKLSTGYQVGLQKNDGQSGLPSAADYDNNLSGRYQPWGRPNGQLANFNGVDANPYNLAYRDPIVWDSDNWEFPTNLYPTVGWLGRVHRGTPWQTVFLKSSNILATVQGAQNVGTNTWVIWTGDENIFDATNSAPVQDRLLFDLFTARFNDNATRGTLSVNQTHLAAWSAVFGGMIVLSNSTASPRATVRPSATPIQIDPAGPAGSSSLLGALVNSINAVRADPNLFPQGAFTHLGDVLSAAALSDQSPFLNLNNINQFKYGISDALYEWLPQQSLGLLRSSSTPRFVIYCYGQTLKPARNSLVTSSSALASGLNPFGLCTNYQVVAESAARAVIRVDNATTKSPRVVVESYNPLPPQ